MAIRSRWGVGDHGHGHLMMESGCPIHPDLTMPTASAHPPDYPTACRIRARPVPACLPGAICLLILPVADAGARQKSPSRS